MTLDYDRLRDTVRNLDAPESGLAADAQCDLYEHAEEIARDLLALRDGVEELAAWVRKVMKLNIDNPHYSAALTPVWYQVYDLLNGDYE